MNTELKWYEVLGGLAIGIVGIAYMATKDISSQEPAPAAPSQIAAVTEPEPPKEQPKFAYNVNQTDPNNFDMIMQLAMRGNYQAQRNVAYGFAAMPYNGQQKNPVLACAWYLVVLNSGSEHLDLSDAGNAETYCGHLEADLLETAKIHAGRFAVQIAENTRFGKLD